MEDFSSLFNEGIDMLIFEYNKCENKEKIERNILDPIVNYLGQQLWPYILTASTMMVVVFLLLFYIVYKMGTVQSSMKAYSSP
jgi:predicted PurR-regulated permease PerM